MFKIFLFLFIFVNSVNANEINLFTSRHYESDAKLFRKFTLSDEIIVKNAEMKDGMLYIKLERFIPENKKPKLISIK